MANIHGQHDSGDPDGHERRIGDVIAQQRAKLLENETLHTGMPMAGTLLFSSHDKRLRGGGNAAQTETSRSAIRGTRDPAVQDETR
jgi:hypothetical protein